jgi:ABC-2 type transport system permease protein
VNAWSLARKYLAVSVRAQMQYRASFVMVSLSQFLVTLLEFAVVVALFDRFGQLRGWSLAEVALFYGIVNSGFALAETVAWGFDSFDQMVKSGDFDRILLRPVGTAFQISAANVRLNRVGRLLQALGVLGWSIAALELWGSPARLLLLLFAIAGTACLFVGLFVLQATLAFWSTESLEIINTVTYGGTETGQYPIAIYQRWFRRFFTVVVPLACVTYFPALVVLGRATSSATWAYALAPAVGIVFLLASSLAWRLGVRHYRSTGS